MLGQLIPRAPSTFLGWQELAALLGLGLLLVLYHSFNQKMRAKLTQQAKKLYDSGLKPMPRPPSLPIIGHMHLLRDYAHNPWLGFQEIRKEYGDIVSLKMGVHQMMLVSSLPAMREILLVKGEIFADRPTFARHHIIFGGDKENSLALCNWSKIHRDRRKFCKRGIAPSKLSARNQLMEATISKFVANFVQCRMGQPEIVSKEHILFLTSDIFMEFLCREQRPHQSERYKDFVNGCDFVFWDINQSYLIDFLPQLMSLGVSYKYLKQLKNVTDFLRVYIDEEFFNPRMEKLMSQEAELDAHEDPDYLDTIINDYRNKVSLMSLADFKVGFADLLAGNAAVANVFMRNLGYLALDERMQDMIYEEAKRNDISNLCHKPSLPITEAAFYETLRLGSSPIVPHLAKEDTSISGFHVPKGTSVLFNLYSMNMSDELWKDPQEYDPMRFLEVVSIEKTDDNSNQAEYKLNTPKFFMPFSIGMRQCMGFRITEATTIIAIANICRFFKIKADDESVVRKVLTPCGSLALKPGEDDFVLRFYPRC